MNILTLSFLTMIFHYPLQWIHYEKNYFERYSVNLMRSIACFVISTDSLLHLLSTPSDYCSIEDHHYHNEKNIFYFFLAYIYYDTVLLLYQHYLGLEKRLRYDLLLHHLLALVSLTFIQNYNLYSFVPLIGLSEGLSILSGVKLLANLFQNKKIVKYCLYYRIYFIIFIRMMVLWPYLFFQFFYCIPTTSDSSSSIPTTSDSSSSIPTTSYSSSEVFHYDNLFYISGAILMIYSAESLWLHKAYLELKSI